MRGFAESGLRTGLIVARHVLRYLGYQIAIRK
jgi:hypothetical protein